MSRALKKRTRNAQPIRHRSSTVAAVLPTLFVLHGLPDPATLQFRATFADRKAKGLSEK